MRTKLLFLFISCSLFGQNAELFSNDWYISQIVMNGQTTVTPFMNIALSKSNFITFTSPGNGYIFNSKHFNSCQVEITFPANVSTFTKVSSGCTLAMYGGDNSMAVNSYDQKHTDFYIYPSLGSVFEYEIVTSSSGKTLIITDAANNNKIYYNNAFLDTKENAIKKAFKLYPNPSTDFLIIENVEKNLKLRINDLSGKILFETLTSDKTQKIDISSFATGQYILNIENFKPEFFIKK
ncbi:T9SS type A sorting domain-containing protein [Chryseobacterium sp. Ch-15]|uniref:T9SS type A sorting domain-containing protein n=1 Tax=Chryseobacterium muglaense TaxID=2893752 RepID=A0A9Q3UTJ9_9FLAO|nr:T9SS type A sorting domain-containing protein [Chryseobacterium muglaense]MBD3905094.1 T9SS type A sorting domain-containing protein [Chryseobacterium muglaense]MCC9033465.1 T9SS type A sorting domain-containing protein [Chryseobacterium muglaense]MCM2554984.1 T9SS type A sorting domain-containing protein [Chryseobacterium muglaense]